MGLEKEGWGGDGARREGSTLRGHINIPSLAKRENAKKKARFTWFQGTVLQSQQVPTRQPASQPASAGSSPARAHTVRRPASPRRNFCACSSPRRSWKTHTIDPGDCNWICVPEKFKLRLRPSSLPIPDADLTTITYHEDMTR